MGVTQRGQTSQEQTLDLLHPSSIADGYPIPAGTLSALSYPRKPSMVQKPKKVAPKSGSTFYYTDSAAQ